MHCSKAQQLPGPHHRRRNWNENHARGLYHSGRIGNSHAEVFELPPFRNCLSQYRCDEDDICAEAVQAAHITGFVRKQFSTTEHDPLHLSDLKPRNLQVLARLSAGAERSAELADRPIRICNCVAVSWSSKIFANTVLKTKLQARVVWFSDLQIQRYIR